MYSDSDVSALCTYPNYVSTIPGESQMLKNSDAKSSEPGGWSPMLLLAGVVCCLGSALPAGFNIGVMNNPAQLMQDFCNESIKERYGVQLSTEQLNILWSGIVSVFLIGGVSGSLTAILIADKFGRKGALATGNICGIIGAVCFLLTHFLNSTALFMLGRLVVGLSGGLATSLVPMYMAEIAPLRLRGAVGVLCQLGITSGVICGQIAGLDSVLGTETLWPYMLASYSPLCLAALLITFILPESPKFLYVVKGQKETALKELCLLRNMNLSLLQNEIISLDREVALRTATENWSMARVIKDLTLRLPLILVCLLQGGQQLSGINAVFYYSHQIFLSAGLGTTGAQYATLCTGLANVIMAIISVPLLSYFGRKTLLLRSCFWSICCLVILCLAIVFIHANSIMPWLCVVAVMGYVVTYGIGLGPIPYFIGSDLFEVGPRSVAMALGSVCNWGGNFFIGMTFPSLQLVIGPYIFIVFACCILFVALFCRKYLPETRGKNTSEITAMMVRGFRSNLNPV